MATLPVSESVEPCVSVEEYLHTSYEPDCDFVDGRLEDRNVGEYDHGSLQTLLATLFTNLRTAWGVRVVTDVRTQISPSHYRVPDLSVLRADAPREQIIRHPQLIAIEILSPEDRISRFQDKIDDYLAFGIEHVWIIDPSRRTAYFATKTGLHLVQTGELIVPDTPIRVVLSELFAELDRE